MKFFIVLALTCCSVAANAQTVVDAPQTAPVTDTSKVFERVEIEAEFPGGNAAWREFLM
ncbi:MAG: hypothetical protein JWQ27_2909 [Ferruginibacter sp.]|nr:hypothetical protein [Ferruginibacter sp.]